MLLTVSLYHHLQVLPHSRVSGYTFLPSRSSVFLFPHHGHCDFTLSHPSLLLFHRLNQHFGLALRRAEIFAMLEDFINLFSESWAVPTVIGSAGDANQRLKSLLSSGQASKSGSFCPRMTVTFLQCSGND